MSNRSPEAQRDFVCAQYKIKPELYDLFLSSATDEQARQAFAASFSIPVGVHIPPIATIRNIFGVRPIPPGQLAVFPKRFGTINAWQIPRVGEMPQNVVTGDDIFVQTFKIGSSVEWDIDYARDGRWDIVEGAMIEFADSIVRQEEAAGWQLIRSAVLPQNTVTTGEGVFSKHLINTMITTMRSYRYNPQVIYCSPQRAGDIRDWAQVTASGSTSIDPLTQREIFTKGYLGTIYNVNIIEYDQLANNEVYLFDTDHLGVMPVRGELATFDDPVAIKKMRHGIFGWEEIGLCVTDSKGIVKGTI